MLPETPFPVSTRPRQRFLLKGLLMIKVSGSWRVDMKDCMLERNNNFRSTPYHGGGSAGLSKISLVWWLIAAFQKSKRTGCRYLVHGVWLIPTSRVRMGEALQFTDFLTKLALVLRMEHLLKHFFCASPGTYKELTLDSSSFTRRYHESLGIGGRAAAAAPTAAMKLLELEVFEYIYQYIYILVSYKLNPSK